MEILVNYLKIGEKPNSDLMLQRLGEYDKCLITGETNDLVNIPVDLKLDNVLASNMARIKKDLQTKINGAFGYTLSVFNVVIDFETPSIFEMYNRDKLAKLTTSDFDFPSDDMFQFLVNCYISLTASHFKGITKIWTEKNDVQYYMDAKQFQNYCMSVLFKAGKDTKIQLVN
jgi:hypothetical protein